MIYTVTPNPALDLGGNVAKLIPSEKAYVFDETHFPGGNGVNAARIIKKMGMPVVAGGFLGGGVGQEIQFLLQKEGVACEFIAIRRQTRIGVTVTDQTTDLQTRLSFPGPKIHPREVNTLMHWVDQIQSPALIIIGGSLPPGFSVEKLGTLLRKAQKRGIPCIVDVPGQTLQKLISSAPLLIKPNLTEFQDLVGRKTTSIQQVLRESRKLNRKIPFVCVSSVQGGALLVTRKQAWFGKIPRVTVKTTVGAGDSMVGAMTAQLWKQGVNNIENVGELLRWGLAAATASLITPGTMLGEYEEMIKFYPKIQITQIA